MSSLSYKTLVNNGPPNNRINLVFIGDGYTQSELDNKYLNDVNTNVNYLFKSGGLIEPFPSYANYFNIYAVSIASSESGADEPTKNVYKSTALDASFAWGFPDHTVDHSLFFNTKLADYAVSTAFTGTGIKPDIKVGLVNTDRSGGTGEFGGWGVSPGTKPDIMAHEMGHSFILLADEYSHIGGSPGFFGEPIEVNVTWDKTGAKWSHWMGYDDGILGPIGVFEGAKYKIKGAYRATETSMMKESGQPFNAIGQEAFLLRLYRHIDHADDYSLKGTNYKNSNNIYSIGDYIGNPGAFIIDPIDQDKIKVEWFVNNAKVDKKSDIFSLEIQNLNLSNGTYSIDAVLEDPNPKVRKSNTIMKKTLNWQIKIDNSKDEWTTDGTTGNDTINLGDGNDIINGGAGNDIINGGNGNDIINGGNGDDTLSTGAGDDKVYGEAGDDIITIAASGNGNTDVMDGGADADVLQLSSGVHTFADNAKLVNIEEVKTHSSGSEVVLTAQTEALKITGGAGVDKINGGAGIDTIDGGGDADIITGGSGNDIITGGTGSDTFKVDAGSDTIKDLATGDKLIISENATANAMVAVEFTATSDTVNHTNNAVSKAVISTDSDGATIDMGAASGVFTLTGGAGVDKLTGGDGADTIDGAGGDDKIDGGSGNDKIFTGTGKDYLAGNSGDDVFHLTADNVWSSSSEAWNVSSDKKIFSKTSISGKNKFEDVLDGSLGQDVIQLTNGSDAFFLHDATSNFHDSISLSNDSYNQKNAARLILTETINGGDGDDLIDLTSPDTQLSYAMNINGGSGKDIIWSSAGSDTLNGGDGDDVLFGGKGIDNLTGGKGADTFEFFNQSGNDIIKDYNKADGDKLAFYVQSGDNQSVSFSGDKITWGSIQIQLEGLTISSTNDFLVEYNTVA